MKTLRYNIVAFLLLLLMSNFSFAQIKPLHLNNKMKYDKSKEVKDTATVGVYLFIIDHYFEKAEYSNFVHWADSATYYSKKAQQLSRTLHYDYGVAHSNLVLAKIAVRLDQLDNAARYSSEAINIFEKAHNRNGVADACLILLKTMDYNKQLSYSEKALKLYKETGNVKGEANALKTHGWSFICLGKIEEGQADLFKSLKLYDKIGFKQVQLLYAWIGLGYVNTGQLDKALEYTLKAITLVENFNDTSWEASDIYNCASITARALDNREQWIMFLRKAKEISEIHGILGQTSMIENNLVAALVKAKKNTEAVFYLKKLEKNLPKLPGKVKEMVVNRSISIYTKLGDYKSAARFVPQATAMMAAMNDNDFAKANSYEGLIKYYFGIGQYDTARKLNEEFQQICERKNLFLKLKTVHEVFFKLDSVQKRFDSALHELDKIKQMDQKMFTEQKNKQIAELQVKYDLEQKEKDNKLLKKQAELQQSKLEYSDFIKDVSLVSIIILAAFLGILYVLFNVKQRNNIQLKNKQNEITQQNSLLHGLVLEKESLVKEVHHRVKNNLQIVMSLLNTQSYFLKDDSAMAAIRNSQHRIHSMSLIHKKLYQSENIVAIALPEYINELIEYLQPFYQTSDNIKFITEVEDIELSITQAVPLGLILNEAITNAFKHAFPEQIGGTIKIQCSRINSNHIQVNISDDGVGMPELQVNENLTLGMKLIYGFSRDLDADIEINYKEGVNIRLIFELQPVNEHSIIKDQSA